ncbi:MAG: aminoglycoside phosphotransferase family protein [Actinobacteria bacterium]|nr:aminoglycoside phosphotransferase family protein [Actinomycetota bacterium]
MTALDPAVKRWIEEAVGPGSHVVAVQVMPPSSTAKHAVDVLDTRGRQHRLVLRRYHDRERLGADPWYDPANEARVLLLLAETPVAAPRLYAADLGALECDVPALLEERIPGRSHRAPQDGDLEGFLRGLARPLPAIHAVEAGGAGLPLYAPYADPSALRPPAWSANPSLWERLAEVVAGPRPADPARFIHRDYHQGNVLWKDGRLSGVVDWTTGCWGPPGIDLARLRLNLAREVSPEAAERFLQIYPEEGGSPTERHPYWDLLDAADMADTGPPADADEAASWRRLEEYVVRVAALM